MDNKIFCAVDTGDMTRALHIAKAMEKTTGAVKLGLEFFVQNGADGVEQVTSECPGLSIFLDLKFHDIPNTVAGAVRNVCSLQADFTTIHTSGGLDMMRAATEAAHEYAAKHNLPRTKILGVTVLTSLDDGDMDDVGQCKPVADQVKRLAALAQKAGLDGIVCSSHEIAALREALGPDLILMVPGIRPAGGAVADQKRVMTPPEALTLGATHLVIGRPITEAADPAQAAQNIISSL
ncbi:MAG: orotidine-5'-phosphate decarboxylase [Alphaproteobacteria bacterium]|nr:orotidine-5'-phosphate decarboxylase [Alphaproteobacteria bacterium]